MVRKSVAKAVHRKLVGGGAVLVRYDYVVGEQEVPKQVLLDLNGRGPEETIHEYFKDFWGPDTRVEEKGGYYAERCWQAAVSIQGWQEVPPKDLEVLREYIR